MKRWSVVSITVALVGSSVLTGCGARVPPDSWQVEYAYHSEGRHDGGGCSLALDTEGHPRVAYRGDHLLYAWNDGTGWHTEVVDDGPQTGYQASLASDASGQPHIAYSELVNYHLKYAYRDGEQWIVQTVDSASRLIGSIDSALDDEGTPHIAYYDATRGSPALKHAVWTGASWEITVVDRGWIHDISLALNTLEQPCISYTTVYREYGPTSLVYTCRNGKAWEKTTIAENPGSFVSNSLAFDGVGRPHISFHNDYYGTLNYAYWDGSNWVVETVDGEEDDVGAAPSLALDAQGRPHISYSDITHRDLRYAFWDGESWVRQTIDRRGFVGSLPSLALDADDHPHIAYLTHDHDLKYAHFEPSAP